MPCIACGSRCGRCVDFSLCTRLDYYAWLKKPLSRGATEDGRQTDLFLKPWEESGKVSGSRKLHDDLIDQGETCCPNGVARLSRLAGIKAQIGYQRRRGIDGGRPCVIVDNTLDKQFDVAAPDEAWVTDITYIRTCEGFAYLAVVIDLHLSSSDFVRLNFTGPSQFASLSPCLRLSSGR